MISSRYLSERGGRPRRDTGALADGALVACCAMGVTNVVGVPSLWQPRIGTSAPAQPPTTPAKWVGEAGIQAHGLVSYSFAVGDKVQRDVNGLNFW